MAPTKITIRSPWSWIGCAAGLILSMTACAAAISGLIWVIVTAWRAIIGN